MKRRFQKGVAMFVCALSLVGSMAMVVSAASVGLSPNTIGKKQTMYYWSGGNGNVINQGKSLTLNFQYNQKYKAAYGFRRMSSSSGNNGTDYITNSGYTLKSGNTKVTSNVNGARLRMLIKNQGDPTIKVTSGSLVW